MELQQILRLLAGIAGAYLTILFLGIVFWTYRDIRSRTRDGLVQFFNVAIVFIFNIPGLFI
ncbi:MAG: hypothetical protein HY677_05765, partial [Chloroflexi bacterium]|nr:hypothetical protein [Chloroflexota bacterium]